MKATTSRWLVALAVGLPLVWLGLQRQFPPLAGPVELVLSLPAGEPGRTVPLVVTGDTGAGDLLYARYTGATTVVFGYDSWAVGGPVSAPVALAPGAGRPLTLVLPSLAAPPRVPRGSRGALRVIYDGREVLRADVHYYGRQPGEVYFGLNPIGGTIVNHRFNGNLATTRGAPLLGQPTALFPWHERLIRWVLGSPGSALGALALSLAAGLLTPLAQRHLARRAARHPPIPAVAAHTRPPHVTFAAVAIANGALFTAVVTGFTFRLFETESFGQFYDYQVAGLLQGRLDVPEAALGAESFVYDGKHYGYFGPTPALLRLPFALTGAGFGRLSRLSLLTAYLASLAGAYALLLVATRRLAGAGSWPARRHVVLLVGGAGLGSTLFFLASRAYLYHEAILWGVAFALGSTWGTLQWLDAPGRHRWWLLALAGGVLSVHARPPTGLFALGVLGTAAAWIAWGVGRARPLRGRAVPALVTTGTQRRDAAATPAGRSAPSPPEPDAPAASALLVPLAVGVLAVLGVLSFNGLSYLKFRSFDGAPLRYHVQYHPERIAAIEGRNFHPGNLPYGFANYTWRPNFTLRASFPFFFIHGCDPVLYPGARIDLAENVLPLPYSMPALVFLAGAGAWFGLYRWPAARTPLAVVAAGALPMALALCAAVAVSQRYTADFVPALIAAAAFGTAALTIPGHRTRRFLGLLAVTLTVLAAAVTLAITLHYQGEVVWGVPAEVTARYAEWRETVDRLFGIFRP